MKSRMKSGDHPHKAKYYLVTDSEQYREGKVKRTPGGVKENLKPYVYKQIEHVKVRYRTFVERSSELLYMARLSTK